MKTLIIAFIVIPLIAIGQIEVKETKSPHFVKVGYYKYSDFNKGDLDWSILENDTTLVLSRIDQRYPKLQENANLIFKGGNVEKEQLYSALMSFYTEENISKDDYQLNIKLGTHDVKVSKVAKMIYMSSDKGDFSFKQGNNISLFGKK